MLKQRKHSNTQPVFFKLGSRTFGYQVLRDGVSRLNEAYNHEQSGRLDILDRVQGYGLAKITSLAFFPLNLLDLVSLYLTILSIHNGSKDLKLSLLLDRISALLVLPLCRLVRRAHHRIAP